MAPLFLLTLNLRLHGCYSLKEKRSRMAPLLAKLKKVNVSVIESGFQDSHQQAKLSIAKLSLSAASLDRDLDQLLALINTNYGDIDLIDYEAERIV